MNVSVNVHGLYWTEVGSVSRPGCLGGWRHTIHTPLGIYVLIIIMLIPHVPQRGGLTNGGFIWFWKSRVFTMYTTSVYRLHTTLCAFM